MRAYFLVSDARYYANVLADISCPATTVQRIVLPHPHIGSSKLGVRIARRALHELRDVFRLLPLALRGSSDRTVFVCATSHYAALLSARIASTLGRRTDVFLFNFYLHQMGQHAAVRRVLKTLMGGQVGLVVQSPDEVDYYSSLAPHAIVEYEPWGCGPIAALGTDREPRDYVFSGGYTNRDYDLYIAAAEILSHVPFVLACATANRLPAVVPPNVRIIRDSSWNEFHQLIAAARLVVLPLKDDVGSSGQMVALAAMQAAKCVIYTDIPVVGQYFCDGLTGLACPIGNLDRIVELIARWYADKPGAERIGRSAREVAETFSAEAFESAIARRASIFMSREPGGTNTSVIFLKWLLV